jgi:hypothetical protein
MPKDLDPAIIKEALAPQEAYVEAIMCQLLNGESVGPSVASQSSRRDDFDPDDQTFSRPG